MDLLRHLQFFTTVARTAHFGRAAELLGMTQPPLSQGVKRLESALEVALFDRTTRGVRLTDAGRALLEPADAVLVAAERFRATTEAVTSRSTSMALGVTDALPEDALGVLAAVPGVGVSGGQSCALLERVANGELALAVVEHPAPLPAMHGGAIVRVATAVACMRPVGTLKELAGHPLVTRERRAAPAAHDLLIDVLRERAWEGSTAETSSHRELITRLLGGSSWAVLPRASSLPGSVVMSTVRGVPPMRVRTIWRADAPPAIAAAGREVTAALTTWSSNAGG